MKRFLFFIVLAVFNEFIYGIDTIKFTVDSSNYNDIEAEMYPLEKYIKIRDFCIKHYFPKLENGIPIYVGEDANGYLKAENSVEHDEAIHANTFGTEESWYIMFSGECFFNRDEMIQLMCHELAHISSDSADHSSEEYQREAKRLQKEYDIDINTSVNLDVRRSSVRFLEDYN